MGESDRKLQTKIMYYRHYEDKYWWQRTKKYLIRSFEFGNINCNVALSSSCKIEWVWRCSEKNYKTGDVLWDGKTSLKIGDQKDINFCWFGADPSEKTARTMEHGAFLNSVVQAMQLNFRMELWGKLVYNVKSLVRFLPVKHEEGRFGRICVDGV